MADDPQTEDAEVKRVCETCLHWMPLLVEAGEDEYEFTGYGKCERRALVLLPDEPELRQITLEDDTCRDWTKGYGPADEDQADDR